MLGENIFFTENNLIKVGTMLLFLYKAMVK